MSSSYPAIIAQVLPRLQALKLPRHFQSTWLHRFLWQRGIALPPPVLAGFLPNFTIFALRDGFIIALMLFLLRVSYGYMDGFTPLLFLRGWLIVGVFFGFLQALSYRGLRIRFALPTWREVKQGKDIPATLKQPPRKNPILPFWLRIPLGLACWLLLSLGFFLLLAPKLDTPNAFFSVCILDDARPQLVRLAAPTQWQSKPLCREPLYFEENDGLHRIYLERDGDALYVREFADSMGDPLEFSYCLDDSTQPPTITPLWWRRGTLMMKPISAFIAIPFAMVFYRILRRMIVRRFYREKKDASANAIH
ncbi:MAG: DUF6404 family protein [Cardiobacterium sp.]